MGVAKPVSIGSKHFLKKGDALHYLHSLLANYSPGDRVCEADTVFLLEALKNHPDCSEKLGVGAAHLEVQAAEYGTQCFCIIRSDGSRERFSYKSCLP
jgi:hypothetical protein